jgi:hypothetical protein
MCVQVVCHIFLERSWQKLQSIFRTRVNWRFTQEVMNFQNGGSPNFENFETPNLGVLGKMTFGCSLVVNHKEYYKGESDGFFKSKLWWVLWVCVCSWFLRAPKVLQLCTNQLVVWFVQINMNNWFACHSS